MRVARSDGCNFNPRSPRGERRCTRWADPEEVKFQSTLPARGATVVIYKDVENAVLFQSTLPARGATRRQPSDIPRVEFQSTLPARGATEFKIEGIWRWKFQSTLPARGATVSSSNCMLRFNISIHAPREGSDGYYGVSTRQRQHFNPRSPRGERPALSLSPGPKNLFQSTLPARGATLMRPPPGQV